MFVVQNADLCLPNETPLRTLDTSLRRVTVIEPRNGLAGLNLVELWDYRDLLATLAPRDIRLRYRQTAFGIAGVVLQPLLTSLVQNANLVSKIYFARIILPLSIALSSLINFGVSFGLMIIFMASFRIVPTSAILLLPIGIRLLLFMAIGCGLYLPALTVTYRDVPYVTPVFVPLLALATPMGYPIAMAHVPNWARPFWDLNPWNSLMEAMRWSLLGRSMSLPSTASLACDTFFAIVALVGGVFAFHAMERKLVDVI